MKRRDQTSEERAERHRQQQELAAKMIRDDLTPEQREEATRALGLEREDGKEAFDELLKRAAKPKK